MKGRLEYSPKPHNDQLWVWWLSPVACFFSGLMWGETANLINDHKTTIVNVLNRREIMRRFPLFLTSCLLLVLSFGLAHGQTAVTVSAVQGTYGGDGPDANLFPDTIRTGQNIVFTIHFRNGETLDYTAGSNGWRLYTPDGAVWQSTRLDTLVLAGGGWKVRSDLAFAMYPTEIPVVPPDTSGLVNDGVKPDTVGILYASSDPPHFEAGYDADVARITISPFDDAQSGKTLCIDSAKFGTDQNEWVWGFSDNSSVVPFWNGPLCFTIYKVPNECPVFAPCPGAQSFNHCNTAIIDFNASDPENDSYTFSYISGPGTAANLNSGTGVWTYSPNIGDVGAATLVVGVTDGVCGGTTQCSVPLTFTNICPSFTAGCNATVNVGKGNPTSINFDAISNDCDPFTFTFEGISGSPVNTPTINSTTGVLSFLSDISEGNQSFVVTVGVTDSKCKVTCTATINVLAVEPYEVQIEKTHGTIQGTHELVCVTLNKGSEEIWGFDFLIAYDNSALSFVGAIEGEIYAECGWEYFTYRYGASGNCGNACPKGLLRVIGLAETNNGPNHPDCYLPTNLPVTLFCLDFLVTNDRTFECMYAPIRFYWNDCGDNTISYNPSDDPTGFVQQLAISRELHEFDGVGGNIANGSLPFPTYYGAPDVCLEGGGDGKPAPIRFLDLINGGVDIVCADSIDDRGDVNLNGLSNEIADAVLFSNYFVYGLGVFTVNPAGQIAATDINADGLVLSVADLVYLIRVVVGDVQAYPKLAPIESVLKIDAKGILSIDNVQVGAANIILEGNVAPTLLADNMKLVYAYDAANNVTRTLIFSMEAGQSFTGSFLNTYGADIVGVEMATYEGAPILAKEVELPTEFALNQNYPNPFNPKTVISFALPTTSDYTLTIYNVTGQKVTEFAGSAQAGTVEVDVDATNYSSGVYFYKLIADNGKFTQTKKMVLVK
jgi:hypothetical protein